MVTKEICWGRLFQAEFTESTEVVMNIENVGMAEE